MKTKWRSINASPKYQSLRISHVFWFQVLQHFGQIFLSFPLSHWQVVKQIVAAISWGRTRHVSLEVGHEPERATHEVGNVLRFQVTTKQQVITCKATHWPPINHTVFPFRVVSEERGRKMLYGVESTRMSTGSLFGSFMRMSKVVTVSPPTSSLRDTYMPLRRFSWLIVNEGILFIANDLIYQFNKRPRDAEAVVGHTVPEVKILRRVSVFQWHVAYDAE